MNVNRTYAAATFMIVWIVTQTTRVVSRIDTSIVTVTDRTP